MAIFTYRGNKRQIKLYESIQYDKMLMTCYSSATHPKPSEWDCVDKPSHLLVILLACLIEKHLFAGQ